jgi:RNA recognition motif-containing protein
LRPAGRILRADVALAPDGRSKGYGTAVFATTQEAQTAIDMFDGHDFDGRIIRVRWDKYQAPSSPIGSISSSQMQPLPSVPVTPRPPEYVAMNTNTNWQGQYLGVRPLGSLTSLPTGQNLGSAVGPPSQFHTGYTQNPFTPAAPTPSQNALPGTFMYNPWYGYSSPGYSTTLPPVVTPQVRLPTTGYLSPGSPSDSQRDNLPNFRG